MRKWSYIFSLAACNALLWPQAYAPYGADKAALWFFDVGQGDSSLIDLGPVEVLIDGGPPNGKGAKELARALGPADRTIDIAILTHPHLDHWGGLPDIFERYRVRRFMTGGAEGGEKHADLPEPDLVLGEGDAIRWKEWRMSVLSPDAREKGDKDPNKASVVILLEGPGMRALYMGDAHETNETRLRRAYDLKADIVKVGHHGSRFSSSAAFLKEIGAKAAVISAGKNSYGHPAPDALRRIRESGAEAYATIDYGTIRVGTDGKTIAMKAERRPEDLSFE